MCLSFIFITQPSPVKCELDPQKFLKVPPYVSAQSAFCLFGIANTGRRWGWDQHTRQVYSIKGSSYELPGRLASTLLGRLVSGRAVCNSVALLVAVEAPAPGPSCTDLGVGQVGVQLVLSWVAVHPLEVELFLPVFFLSGALGRSVVLSPLVRPPVVPLHLLPVGGTSSTACAAVQVLVLLEGLLAVFLVLHRGRKPGGSGFIFLVVHHCLSRESGVSTVREI